MSCDLYKRFHRVVPVRYVVCFLCFWCYFCLFGLRTNMPISLVAMTTETEGDSSSSDECPILERKEQSISTNYTSNNAKHFQWDQKQQGFLLSAYFIGFTVTQLLGGLLSKLYRPKWVTGLGLLSSAILTVVAPAAAYGGYWLFFTVRLLTGLTSGLALPSVIVMISRWSPIHERAMLLAVVYSGTTIGAIITQFSSGFLIAAMDSGGEGWMFPFYVFGGFACVWFVFWTFLITNSPEDHVAISQKELDLLNYDLGEHFREETTDVPWFSILTSLPFWAFVSVNVSHNWGLDLFQMQLPNFFKYVLHFNVDKNGLYSSLPFIVKAIVTFLAGAISTWIQNRFDVSINILRKSFTLIAYYGAGAFILGLGYECDEWLNIVLMCLTMGIFGFYCVGPNCTATDMSPKLSGVILGLSNTIGNVAGFLCPVVTAHLVSHKESLANWRMVFLIASCFYIVTATFFLIFGSSKLQPWAEGKRSRTANSHPQSS